MQATQPIKIQDLNQETKHDRFVRLVEQRASIAIKAIHRVGNLGDRSHYDYSDEEADQVIGALEHALTKCRERFRRGEAGVVFKLNTSRE